MNLKNVVKYRSVWMGLAILGVIFYHSGFLVVNEVMRNVKNIAYGGVDVFFFASGIGCYYSFYSKSLTSIFIMIFCLVSR